MAVQQPASLGAGGRVRLLLSRSGGGIIQTEGSGDATEAGALLAAAGGRGRRWPQETAGPGVN